MSLWMACSAVMVGAAVVCSVGIAVRSKALAYSAVVACVVAAVATGLTLSESVRGASGARWALPLAAVALGVVTIRSFRRVTHDASDTDAALTDR